MHLNKAFLSLLCAYGVTGSPTEPSTLAKRAVTDIPRDSFNALSTHWNNFYPWGQTHNGAARMELSQVKTSNGELTITATPVSGYPAPIKYLSGAIHAKKQFKVATGGGYDFSGEFIAPVTRGTWPAFWLNAWDGWPPEIDLAEWKGDAKIWFNTFNSPSAVVSKIENYPNAGSWHTIKVELRDANGTDVTVKFYLDGRLVATQTAQNYIGKPLRLWVFSALDQDMRLTQDSIINYQMEGSSGSPGPTTATTYRVRNVEVINYNP